MTNTADSSEPTLSVPVQNNESAVSASTSESETHVTSAAGFGEEIVQPQAPETAVHFATSAAVEGMASSSPSQSQESSQTPSEENLREKYARLAEEFRSLGQKQINGTLNPDEMKRKRELDEMAAYGLFVPNQAESQLKAKDEIFRKHAEAATKEFSNLGELAEELRSLRKKLYASALGPEEFARVKYLEMLERAGKFQEFGGGV